MKEFVEKLIERLEEEYLQAEKDMELSDTCDEASRCGGRAAAYEKAQKIVNQLAEEYKGGWIPVSERFPDTDEYILLSFSNFSVPLVGRWEEDEDGGAFYVGDETETCVSQDIFVNAWQPLPTPY